jgi:hypothetical protein
MDSVIHKALGQHTLNQTNLTIDQCDQILLLLLEHHAYCATRLEEGLRLEYIHSRNCLEDLESGRPTLDELAELLGGNGDAQAADGSNGAVRPAPFYYEAEVAACNQLYQLILSGTRPTGASQDVVQLLENELKARVAAKDLFLQKMNATPPEQKNQIVRESPSFLCFLLTASVEPFIKASRQAEAQAGGLQMLFALRRYELAHGKLPATLEAAVAETALKTVPIDPYAQAPLRYAVVAGKPTVYSIGSDGKDDGGQTDWNYGRQPGDFLFVLTPRSNAR